MTFKDIVSLAIVVAITLIILAVIRALWPLIVVAIVAWVIYFFFKPNNP